MNWRRVVLRNKRSQPYLETSITKLAGESGFGCRSAPDWLTSPLVELRGYWIATLTNIAQPYQNADWRWRDLKRLQQEGTHLITLAVWAQETTRIDVFLSVLPAVLSYYDITGQWTDLLSLSMIGLDYAQLMDNTECRLYIQNVMAWVHSQQGKHAEAE